MATKLAIFSCTASCSKASMQDALISVGNNSKIREPITKAITDLGKGRIVFIKKKAFDYDKT